MSARPEVVSCIQRAGGSGVWCGRAGIWLRFCFQSIDRAAENDAVDGRLVPCPACARAVAVALGADTTIRADERGRIKRAIDENTKDTMGAFGDGLQEALEIVRGLK